MPEDHLQAMAVLQNTAEGHLHPHVQISVQEHQVAGQRTTAAVD